MRRLFPQRPTAVAVLAALIGALALPAFGLAHSPDAEDLAWGGPAFATHHVRTQFERVLPSVADSHCIACHLLRAVSTARPHAPSELAEPEADPDRHTFTFVPVLSGKRRGLPSRAPPSVS